MARLGDTAAAEILFRQFQERRPLVPSLSQITGGFAGLALILGRPDEAISEIGRIRPDRANNIRAVTKTLLRLTRTQ